MFNQAAVRIWLLCAAAAVILSITMPATRVSAWLPWINHLP